MLATKTLLLLADDPMIRYNGLSLAAMVMTYTDNFETKMAGMMTENNITMGMYRQFINRGDPFSLQNTWVCSWE